MLEEITDSATLEWALKDISGAAALAVAVRAALRTVPLMELWLAHDEEEAAPMLLPTFRPLAAGWAMALDMAGRGGERAALLARPDAGMLATATEAAIRHATRAVARATSVVANTASNTPFSYARITFAAAVRAAYAATAAAHEGSTARAIAHIAAAAQGWPAISADVRALRDIAPDQLANWLLATPLWPAGVDIPDWAQANWPLLKERLLDRENEQWQVWTDWYDALLHPPANDTGRAEEQVEQARIRALLPEALWQQGPAAANAAIAKMTGG